ncbi:histidine phosphatase family protein [Candidatus Kuenenbacteria bacterium]|nr:histidine phosphatase family protein [Candidatus Kuenenbacteria bacterium]
MSERESHEELPKKIEVEKIPHYIIMITRHAERLPSGELSPEGIAHAQARGENLKGVEVLKSYASDHPSGRAYETAENIGGIADIISPQTQECYRTRRVKDVQYNVIDPAILKEVKLLIEEATLKEIYSEHPKLAQLIESALSEDASGSLMKTNSQGEQMVDIEKLPKDIQRQVAPFRQKNQKVGFEKMLASPEAVKNMAIGLSHQLVGKGKILARYSQAREAKNKSPQKDVVININTHGLFTESLLKNAGIFVKPTGEEIHGLDNIDTDELGGYIQPGESIYLDIGASPNNIPERIPVMFGNERKVRGEVYLDRSKLEQLDQEYGANKKVE